VSLSSAPASVPLLLVTPSFAHWLDSSSPFLSQFLSRLYGNSPRNDTLYAVTAVVDALPNTAPDSPHLSESEGLSLLAVGQSGVQAKVAPPRLIRSSASEETNLLFSFQPEVIGPTGKGPAHEIGLRLATLYLSMGEKQQSLVHAGFGIRPQTDIPWTVRWISQAAWLQLLPKL
jgi:hypothetical protein